MMPRDRVPQNSANVSHRKLFADLQAVYHKIIQTNGASFPLRAKDNMKVQGVPMSPSGLKSKTGNGQHVYGNDNIFHPRAQSACSVEEIVIRPIQVHERELFTPSSRRNSTPGFRSSSPIIKTGKRELHQAVSSSVNGREYPIKPDTIESRFGRLRSKSNINISQEYSEQSIRYVAEQISLEKARQLKQRSNIQQHRVDRKYFVCGSGFPVQKQTFADVHRSITCGPRRQKPMRYNSALYCHRPPPKTPEVVSLTVAGRHMIDTPTPPPTRQGDSLPVTVSIPAVAADETHEDPTVSTQNHDTNVDRDETNTLAATKQEKEMDCEGESKLSDE